MKQEYAVLNPATGQYVRVDSVEAVPQAIAQIAFEFYKWHTHNVLYTTVTVNDDGSETWGSSSDTPQPTLQELLAATETVTAAAVLQ